MRPAPRIHVPPVELEAPAEPGAERSDGAKEATEGEATEVADAAEVVDGAPKRKRTRRGSRGGRRRRKPSTDNGAAVETPAVGEAGTDGTEPPSGYVPMSEWIEDFDSSTRAR